MESLAKAQSAQSKMKIVSWRLRVFARDSNVGRNLIAPDAPLPKLQKGQAVQDIGSIDYFASPRLCERNLSFAGFVVQTEHVGRNLIAPNALCQSSKRSAQEVVSIAYFASPRLCERNTKLRGSNKQ